MKSIQRTAVGMLALVGISTLGTSCRAIQINQLEKRVDQLETRVAVLESQVRK